MLVDTLKTLDRLDDYLEELTPEDYVRAESNLEPIKEGETSVYTVPIELRALWSVGFKLKAMENREDFAVKFECANQEEKDAHSRKSVDYSLLSEGSRILFWNEVRLRADTYSTNMVGLRSGWVIVTKPDEETQEEDSPLSGLLNALGGALGGRAGLQVEIRRHSVHPGKPPEDPGDKKPN